MSSPIAENLASIQEQVNRACDSVPRNPAEITLVAVSKTFSVVDIQAAYDLGLRDFGESKAQELQTKVHHLPNDINWHFIGTLQSNKAKHVAEMSTTIHTIENERQLREIDKQDRTIDGFIQVNIASESQKSGILIESLDTVLSYVLTSHQVRFLGLMTIGPPVQNPEESRPYFRKLAELNQQANGTMLSMGMSNDFDVAIQEGATHIRVGSALFGKR